MKICAAQTIPIKGNIERNIENHLRLIDLAVENKVQLILFPELSLTGYEPELAKGLAIQLTDERLEVFQSVSDNHEIVISIGAPTKSASGTLISMIIFSPGKERQIYSKQHLHPGEENYFTTGHDFVQIPIEDKKITFAICYETSVEAHSEYAFKTGSDMYLVSVLNSVNGLDADIRRLSGIAEKYGMTALMSNYAGQSGGYNCAGKTSAWNNRGELTGQLNDKNEGLLIVDTNGIGKGDNTKTNADKIIKIELP